MVGGTALDCTVSASLDCGLDADCRTAAHRLSGLGHEASHYALFKNRLANELVSDLLCMFPLMAMTQRFRVTHLGHHQFLNDPDRDPDVPRLHFDGDRYPFPMSKATFWYRYVVMSLWPPMLLKYLYGQAKNANVTTGFREPRCVYRFRVGRCLRVPSGCRR